MTQSKQTTLHEYAAIDDARSISKLHELGANLNERDPNDGRTPLHCAVENRSLLATELLMQLGADIDVRDQHGANAEQLALGKLREVRKRQPAQAGVHLTDATLPGSSDKEDRQLWSGLKLILRVIRDERTCRAVEVAEPGLGIADHYGQTGLHHAALRNDTATILAWIDAGVDLEMLDKDGRTALMSAASRGNAEASALLAEHSTYEDWSCCQTFEDHHNVVHLAAKSGDADTLRSLAAVAAKAGRTSMFAAASNEQGEDCRTPLELVLDYGFDEAKVKEMADILIDNGAEVKENPHLRNAARRGLAGLCRNWIQDRGVRPYITCILKAIESESPQTVQVILEGGRPHFRHQVGDWAPIPIKLAQEKVDEAERYIPQETVPENERAREIDPESESERVRCAREILKRVKQALSPPAPAKEAVPEPGM